MTEFSWKSLVNEVDKDNEREVIYKFGDDGFGNARKFYSTDSGSSGIYGGTDVPSGALQIGPDEDYIQIDDDYLIM